MNVDKPSIATIILNWNGKEDTCNCIQSVLEIDFPNHEVTVVDNGSQDGSVEYIKERFPELTVIETGANLGYAGGNNKGISYALSKDFDYVFILNNDTVVDQSILDRFIEASKDNPEAGVFGAKIYYLSEPQKIWFAGSTYVPKYALFASDGFGKTDEQYDQNEVKEIGYACGCAMLVKAEVFRKIGLLEEKYFLNWEEIDFCTRAKKASFQCVIVPEAHVWHKISASFKNGEEGLLRQYFQTRNRLFWIERNFTFPERATIFFKSVLPEVKEYILNYFNPSSNSGQRTKAIVCLVALKDYFLRNFGDCPLWIRSI